MTSGSAPGPLSSPPLPRRGVFSVSSHHESRFPTFSAMGRDDNHTDTPREDTYSLQRDVHISPGFLRLTTSSGHLPHAHSTPPTPLLCPPGLCSFHALYPVPLLTSHPPPFTSPSHSLHTHVLPPPTAHTCECFPLPPKRVRGDLSLGAAPCAAESSHPSGYSPHVRHRLTAGWRSPPA